MDTSLDSATSHNKVAHLLKLLGPAVLLAWPSGSKGGCRKWKHIQLTDMNGDSYLADLEETGNIGGRAG